MPGTWYQFACNMYHAEHSHINYYRRTSDVCDSGDDCERSESTWFAHDMLRCGDYHNDGTVVRSNIRVLQRIADEYERERTENPHADGSTDSVSSYYRMVYGSYGFEAMLITWDVMCEDSVCPPLRDAVFALSDYPIADESDWSDLQCEEENTAWEDYGRQDFAESLGHYELLRGRSERRTKQLCDMLDLLWHKLVERSNGETSRVEHNSYYFRVDNIRQHLEAGDVWECWRAAGVAMGK